MAKLDDGRVRIWDRETGKPQDVYPVDAAELLKQAQYVEIYESDVDAPQGAEVVGDEADYGPPDLDDWVVKDLQGHLLKRFNEKWNKNEYPRKSDLVRFIRGLYMKEEEMGDIARNSGEEISEEDE